MNINIKNNLSLRHYVVAFTTDSLSRFLIKKGVYEQFIKNTIRYILRTSEPSHSLDYKALLSISVNSGLEIDSIIESFVWSNTTEGYEFWSELNKEYTLSKK